MSFTETRERTDVTVALRNEPISGVGELIHFAIGECSLGSILVASTEKGICAILLGDNPSVLRHELREHFKLARLIDCDEDVVELMAKVVQLVESPWLDLDLPFDLRGTSFEQRVWQAVREITSGSTASYTDIAERIGEPKKAFAVAEACASNTLAVAIPCHRVVRKSGALAGYRWGFKRKRVLLAREAAHLRTRAHPSLPFVAPDNSPVSSEMNSPRETIEFESKSRSERYRNAPHNEFRSRGEDAKNG